MYLDMYNIAEDVDYVQHLISTLNMDAGVLKKKLTEEGRRSLALQLGTREVSKPRRCACCIYIVSSQTTNLSIRLKQQ